METTKHFYNPCILYSLPKDVTTQSVGQKTIQAAIAKVNAFLAGFSDKTEIDFYVLTAHIPQPSSKSYSVGLQRVKEAKELFGVGLERSIGYSYPEGRPLPQRAIEWQFTLDKFQPYLDFIISQQPIPAFELPLFELIGCTYFNLIDHNGCALPGQTNHSSLMTWFGRNSSVCPTLWLPFAELGPAYITYKNNLAEKFPGKFNEKYLRRVIPTKSGTNYRVAKL